MPILTDRPNYTNKKLLAAGVYAYYFNPPTWARRFKCLPVQHESLGTDQLAAYKRVTSVLLPMFYSWLYKDAEVSERNPIIGSFEWAMLIAYATHRDFRNLKDSTKEKHMRRLLTICDLRMTDGSRLADWPVKDFSTEVVDGMYEVLLARHPVIIVKLENGKERRIQPGLTEANHIIKLCHTAWASAARSKSSIVPKENPFAIKLHWDHEDTYKATWDELCDFVEKADELGYQDIATAAIIVWELHQRPTSVFGELFVSHYRPDEHPNSIRVIHGKNEGKNSHEMWFSLFDADTESAAVQYDELAPRLEELAYRAKQAGRTSGPLIARLDAKSGIHRGWLGKGDNLSAVNRIVRKIVAAAGLKKKVNLEAFRHGGITGMADADLTDAQMRVFTRHGPRRLPTYIGPTQAQVRAGRKKIKARRLQKSEEYMGRIEIPRAQYPNAPLSA
jgi:hypothetical protein